MATELDDLSAFVAVARAGGFREAARVSGVSASGLSEALRRLETRLGARLLHRTTRSISTTEAGARLFERLSPALAEISAALDTVHAETHQPAGTLRLNVPANVARTVLPGILPPFLKAHPQIRVEVTVEDSFVDILASGADAGIRYEERLEQDMIAVPIGPRSQRIITVAAPAYLDLHGRPAHPRDLLDHACLRLRFSSGARATWEFERGDEVIRLDPPGPLLIQPGSACDLLIEAAMAGLGVVRLFEDWLAPAMQSGALERILDEWDEPFSGPMLYYSGRRQLPPPLRAFIDFTRTEPAMPKLQR
ncbi:MULTISPECIES: LysR family transcriptional regulator [Novosphingobium]|uniref:Bacterial regulatory helix-turn-helix, lysR family protein n=1 Tax=Novosphingobium resinovorum TaxID=158500 RepID=A0A031JF82_9SPHN|nr:LysR family transcriptional regulator [Novosphingobium resinovorum]EZP71831.1 Bacterial regulatory helix-turn-helix, lysR family protein [Novosphingobium resinovorum]GLK46208.1 LysR family transcriptional regulator [Novosphingobium resinovorum]